MTSERISEYSFQAECDEIAQEVFDNALDDMAADETPDHHRDDMLDRVHETVDGHQWVIYHHYAHQICAECNTDEGEAFLEDCGMPETPTYDSLATAIAYGEMRHRVTARIEELIDEWEPMEADA